MSSIAKPSNMRLEHLSCNGFCLCHKCGVCWLNPGHSPRQCVALRFCQKQAHSRPENKHRSGVQVCAESSWCTSCGRCWTLDDAHKDKYGIFHAQVQDMKATKDYIENQNKVLLEEAIQNMEELPMLPSNPLLRHL
jgi:hypothetical protein